MTIYIFYFFAAVLVYFSFRSFSGGIEYLRFFRDRLAAPVSDFTPFATVIVPCRGLDDGLLENLSALLEQDYPIYEVIFVVDDENDPAAKLISERFVSTDRSSVSTRLVVAPPATRSSQKVENLREAVLHADPRSKVFVFVDSDVRPSASWLRNLVAPLTDGSVGAATGYRWFVSRHPTFASEMRSVWNASIASALGSNTGSNFCWGGSLAIRRDVFDRVEMREKWSGTLSDDFAVTRTMNAAGLPIVFVPQALAVSIEDCTFRELFEFTTRQMKITRVYAPRLWILSFFGSGLFNFVMLTAFILAAASRTNGTAVWLSLATILLVSVFSLGKSWLRLKAVRLVLTDYEPELRRQSWTQNSLWLLSPALFFYNSFAALLSRRMNWRGTKYELKSAHETVIIAD